MTYRASSATRSARRRRTFGWPPAPRTASASRVDQMRSSARIATVRLPAASGTGAGVGAASVKAGGEVPEHVARRDDTGGLAAIDDRHVAEAADRHLVDRHGD